MRLDSVLGNSQRLDGGAMFGNCPRALWQKWCEPDDHNRIALATRCLLVRDAGRVILLETGIGAFFPPKLRDRYGVVESNHVLMDSLRELGVSPSDVDVVVLSHLHFDHAGGLLTAFEEGTPPALAFPNATIVVGEVAYQRAQNPHPRDKASFVPQLMALLDPERLEVVPEHVDSIELLGPRFSFFRSHGHTPGQLHTKVHGPRGPVTFMGDLVPGSPWVHLPITMGYDRCAETVIDEKSRVLSELAEKREWLFYTHDPEIAASLIGRNDQGRFVPEAPERVVAWA